MNESSFHPIIPQISVISADALRPDEKQEIISLCAVTYNEDFTQMFALFPQSVHVLARVEDVLVSHACWVTRWLQPDGLPLLRTAYVEAVATAPVYQKQGIGSMIMQRVVAEIQKYDLGGLSPAHEHTGFYKRLGWEMWQGPTAIRTSDTIVETPRGRVMIFRTAQTPILNTSVRITAEWREGDLW